MDRVIAAELEEHRVFEGFARQGRQIKQSELAEQAAMGKDHVGKLLRGERRLSVRRLRDLVKALGLADEVVEHLSGLILRNEDPARTVPAPGRPTDVHRDEVLFSQYPAMLLRPGLFDVEVVNAAAEKMLPRLTEAGNLLRWLLTDPVARVVFTGRTWQPVTSVFTYALHYMSRGVVSEQARTALIKELSSVDEFAGMWSARVYGPMFPLRVQIADPVLPSSATPMTLTVSALWGTPVHYLNVSLVPQS